jgi:glycosyltransferase involved in cell wall biosynthesis
MISVCILAKNSASTLQATLESVRTFPEVLLLDNGSTDETLAIATEYSNVKIVHNPFIGFGALRNLAASQASHDWILALDTDEVLTDSLVEEIHHLPLDSKEVYSIERHNYYNGKHITGCGWHIDRVIRLYNKKVTRYSDAEVHESVKSKGFTVKRLKFPLKHTPFRSTGEFLAKMQHYSSLYAKQHVGKKSSGPMKAVAHSTFAFIRSYFFQGGCLLGAEGFIVSLYNSNTVFYKYIKLWEENNKSRKNLVEQQSQR